jgi:hypothetical protein
MKTNYAGTSDDDIHLSYSFVFIGFMPA